MFTRWQIIQNGCQNPIQCKLSLLGIKLFVLTRLEAWWHLFFDYLKTKMAAGDKHFANVSFALTKFCACFHKNIKIWHKYHIWYGKGS